MRGQSQRRSLLGVGRQPRFTLGTLRGRHAHAPRSPGELSVGGTTGARLGVIAIRRRQLSIFGIDAGAHRDGEDPLKTSCACRRALASAAASLRRVRGHLGQGDASWQAPGIEDLSASLSSRLEKKLATETAASSIPLWDERRRGCKRRFEPRSGYDSGAAIIGREPLDESAADAVIGCSIFGVVASPACPPAVVTRSPRKRGWSRSSRST